MRTSRLGVAFALLLSIVACEEGGTGASGGTGGSGATGGLGGEGGSAIAAPTGLVVSYASATRLHLEWANVAPNATGTQIERGTTAEGPFAVLAVGAAAGETTYEDEDGIELGTQYWYRVSSLEGAVVGAPSDVATAAPPPIPPPPAAPGSITTQVLSPTSIQVSWTHPGTDVAGFRLEHKMNYQGFEYALVADLPATTKTFTDDCLRPGTPYVYRVTAYSEGGEDALVSPANTQTSAPSAAPAANQGPKNLAAVPLTETSVRVEWENSCTQADRIAVEYFDGAAWTSVLGGSCTGAPNDDGCFLSDATNFIYVDLGVGSSYQLRARAMNALGATSNSNTLVVNGPAANPPAGSGSVGVYADYDNRRVYADLLPDVSATAFPSGELIVGCFWSFNEFLGMQDFICNQAAIHFPMNGVGVGGGGFDLNGKTIDQAILVLNVKAIPVDATNYSLSAIATPWSTSTLNIDTPISLYADGASLKGSPGLWGPYAFDVTGIVQAWADGTFENHGVLVEDSDFVFPYADLITTSFFWSTDSYNGNPDNRPTLWVDYH